MYIFISPEWIYPVAKKHTHTQINNLTINVPILYNGRNIPLNHQVLLSFDVGRSVPQCRPIQSALGPQDSPPQIGHRSILQFLHSAAAWQTDTPRYGIIGRSFFISFSFLGFIFWERVAMYVSVRSFRSDVQRRFLTICWPRGMLCGRPSSVQVVRNWTRRPCQPTT